MKTKKIQKTFLHTVIKRSFRADRGRNMVAVFAVMLTTLMFTTLFVLSKSMEENLFEMNLKMAGSRSELTFQFLTEEETARLTAHEMVTDWGRSVVIGVAENKELTGRQVEIRYADENYAESVFSMPTTGQLPVGEKEIALDKITLDRLGLPYELGQEITLCWRKDLNSQVNTTDTFVLSGYWDGNDAAMASMAWVSEAFIEKECAGIDQKEQRAAGQYFGTSMLHVDLSGSGNPERKVERLLAETGLTDVSYGINIAYDTAMSQNILKEVFPMFLCMVLVFVSGYLIIYNIFQISVSADIRFYGRLKTLGVSGKQLRSILYGHAAWISLIGIPGGMALGFLLGAVLVPVMITGTGGKATVSFSPLVFGGSALFSWLTVLISCGKPARIAGKVSPMEALRYTDAGTQSRRKTKRSTGGARIWRMALANLGRNKKRTVTVICSLTLAMLLLSVIYAQNASFDIDKYMSQMVISDFEIKDSSIATNFSRYNPYGTTISEKLTERIEALDGLEAVGRLYSQTFRHPIGASALANIQTYYQAEERLSYIEAADPGLAEEYYDMMDKKACTAILYGVDGLILDTFSKEYRILEGDFDREAFQTGNYVLAQAAGGAEEPGKETQPTYSVGDSVEIQGKTYEVMGIVMDIYDITEGVNGDETVFLSFYLPAERFQELYPDNTPRKFFFHVNDEGVPQAEQMLLDYRKEHDKSMTYVSKATLTEHYKEQTRANTITGFAISIIIAIVGILNFINSMVTAIVSRQKEFAMIQSVGMTKRQLRGMLIDEGLFYAGITLLLSWVFGTLAVAFGVRAMVSTNWTATFHFTLAPLVICTPLLLFLAVLIPYFCFRNLEKQSIVERLRAVD
ncbi:MAG: ABC transporter permease [Lachnospiraceae bacterium]|nr:ABC transporter permease [Lachnospiraceae bacterium]